MSEYDLKIEGKIQDKLYENLKSYINILCEDDKINIVIEKSGGYGLDEFTRIMEDNNLIKISEDILTKDTLKMTYKRRKWSILPVYYVI